jgi:hypothetical protein
MLNREKGGDTKKNKEAEIELPKSNPGDGQQNTAERTIRN